MYPFIRVGLELLRARRMAPLAPGETHVSRTRCWPWDIDPFMELNNGRTLTLMDIGRMSLVLRSGLVAVLRREGWRMTMAGGAVRWRRRVTLMARLEIRSRFVGRDARFLYVEQTIALADGAPAHHAVFRVAVADGGGLVGADRVAAALGDEGWDAPLPGWVAAWAEAESARPWPPEM